MTTAQLKDLLVKKIKKIDDEDRLKFIKEMIEFNENFDEPYLLNDIQKDLITKSDKEIEEGNVKSHESVMKDIDKWLKDK